MEMFTQSKDLIHALKLVYIFVSFYSGDGRLMTQGVFTPDMPRRVSVLAFFPPLLSEQCGLEINYMVVPHRCLGIV